MQRAWLALLVALVTACGGAAEKSPRAVVIGIDSADWTQIDALVDAGRMPNLAALRARGTSGPIETLIDYPLSPVIWTSVATGKTPAKHGITWFLVDQPDGQRVPVRSHNRKVKALWNILSDAGRRTSTVGWWATYPAENVGEGVMVSDALGFHGFGRTAREGDDGRKTHPPERFAEFDALLPTEQQIEPAFAQRFYHLDAEKYRSVRFDPARHPKRDPGNAIHLFQQYAVTAQGYTAIAEKLLAEPYDVLLVYYEQVDSFSHMHMKHTAPKLEWVSDEDHEIFRDVVSEWYAYQDELLGRLLAKIDLDTTAVFVLSDHGFKSGERRIRSEKTVDIRTAHLDHESEGIFLAAGPGIKRGAKIADASVMDLTPTLLHYLGLPVAKDMDGKVLTSLFEPDFADAHKITYVSSYETPGAAPKTELAEDFDADEQAEVMAGLEALGYVTPGEAAASGAAAAAENAGESSPEIHNNLARIHARVGDLDEATAEFEKALALNPHDADALLGLANIAAMRGNRTRAEHLVQVSLATNPDFPQALAQLADLRREAGDLVEAVRLYREAISLDDVSPSLYLGLGDCLQRSGNFEEAEAAFQRVLELVPDSYPAIYNLGVTAFQLRREEDAIARFEQALALNPNHSLAGDTLNNLGTVHLDRGEIEQAAARWEAAIAKSPAQFEARYNLAIIYLGSDRLDDAIGLFEQAARLAPNHETLHTRLGLAYMEKGRNEDAYRALSMVRRLYPENWFAPLGMAVLFAATERLEQAEPLLEDALRLGGEVARSAASGYEALGPLLAQLATAPAS